MPKPRRLLGPIIAATLVVAIAAAAGASIALRPDPVATLRMLPPPVTPRHEPSPGVCR